MADENLKSIKLNIAGKVVPLSVHPDEEAMIQQVAKNLNERINKFQIDYQLTDKMDGVVMLLLTYAIDSQKMENLKSNEVVEELLTELETVLNT